MSKIEDGIAAPDTVPGAQRALLMLWTTVWFALLFGLAEVSARFAQKVALDGILRLSRQAVWMTPAGLFLLMLGPAVVLYLLSLRWRRAASLRSSITTLGFIGFCGVVLLLPSIDWRAAMLVAAGLAWQAGLLGHRYRQRVARWIRKTTPVFATLVVLMAGAVNVGLATAERRAISGLPQARVGAPNIILIIWDTVRAASLSLYGHQQPTTPNLERFARQGVVFDRAIATAPWTLPSHASLFTGQWPFQTSAGWARALDDTHPTLAEVLALAGYATAGFSANMFYVEWEYGLARGFSRFEDYQTTVGQVLVNTTLGKRLLRGRQQWMVGLPLRLAGYEEYVARKPAQAVTADLLRWLDGRPQDRPFFAFLNYFDAHRPYLPPDSLARQFGPSRVRTTLAARVVREVRGRRPWDDPEPSFMAAELAAYQGAIRLLDYELDALLSELRQRGALDNTIVVVTSDHGEEFGEREGIFEHSTGLDLWQLHVPLVVVYPPRVPANKRVEQVVSLRDIPATVLELAGVERQSLPGTPLSRFWEAAPETTGTAYAELTPGLNPKLAHRALFQNELLYIRSVDGKTELYDVDVDDRHRNNLVGKTDFTLRASQLGQSLDAIMRCGLVTCDPAAGLPPKPTAQAPSRGNITPSSR